MRKKISIIIALALAISLLAGCGNRELSDGLTNQSNEYNYILTLEAGEYHLHSITKWSDSDSDALGATTSCCGNRLWASYNTAILYQNSPKYMPDYVIICGDEN